ncbi:RagB/SusD family nutrient uptake outer membrane protein [Formosa haliotis]|uniref:RagB/SusD family nutrient uptake outer membrane protein n=1 Tax=Formosa haliotis TaxID=1555194 RepID=UPI000824B190|nr:RagB/SusD family nutrient uptake outer membrane protein [Formosa haliotis]
MKNIKIIIVLFLGLVTLFAGCSDNFLEEDPKDTLFGNTLFVNRDGMQQGLNAVYNLVRQERTQRGSDSHEASLMWKTGTDVAWGNYSYSSLRAIDIYGANLNAADVTMNSIFNWLYDVVNGANTLISRANSGDIDWQGSDEIEDLENKNLIIAQARLLRAWAYRHLTNTWGDVPLSLEEIDGDTFRTYWERTPVDEIRITMEADLLFAEEYLPDDYSNPLILSSAVAQHYLAELYLTMGGLDNNIKAEQKAEAVINNPNFRLITERYGENIKEPGVPFMDQFGEKNALPSEGNTETLWTFLNAADLTGTAEIAMRRTWVNRFYNLTTDDKWAFSQYGGRGLGRAMHTLYVENLYEDQDDRYSEYAYSKYYLKEEGGDTVYTKVPTYEKWEGNDRYWPGTKKWDSYPDLERVDNSGQYNNMPYLRLAETYLLLAEAEFNLGKLDEAAQHINAVRVRSHATPIAGTDVTIEYILDERARELFSEEHRRYTLNRFGLLVSRTKKYNKFSEIEDKNILYPLPQNFIDSNEGPTEQNPGW